jgi:nicotinamide phosphoribosyltransferase
MTNAILLTDGYKLDHRRQYPVGTQFVYSNWTPRSNFYLTEAKKGAVVFGIQHFVKKYLIEYFNREFFCKPLDEVIKSFTRRVNAFLGPNEVGYQHVADLHKLGYLPIELKALPEGTICPIRVPMLTIKNTLPEFFWITNFLETIMSCELWLPMTSATTAKLYMKELERHANKTGFPKEVDLGFLCHDFSMRGMAGLEAAITSGMGHLTSFIGSETIPAIDAIEEYYNVDAEKYNIANTVPATEHSVMCAGGIEDEFGTFKRLLTELYPKGFVSVVSDTWDYWKVVSEYAPRLEKEIRARDGRFVIRPDSGVPEDIICGIQDKDILTVNDDCYYFKDIQLEGKDYIEGCKRNVLDNPDRYVKQKLTSYQIKGTYECLWDTFGGTVNEKGYKILDNCVGIIYGDSITLDRQKEIYRRLEAKGFAATNLVLGIGSYTYQYRTRDSLGFAMKATWCQISDEPKEIFKQPKTDNGMKNSLKGLIQVLKDENGEYYAKDCVSLEEEQAGELKTVFKDGKIVKEYTFEEIRNNLKQY